MGWVAALKMPEAPVVIVEVSGCSLLKYLAAVPLFL
jgi:hypothetical protein